MDSDVLLGRKLVDRSNGNSLRRNRSPVTIKPKIQTTTTTTTNNNNISSIPTTTTVTSVVTEDHHAMPYTRKIYTGDISNARHLSAVPGPSSTTVTTTAQTDCAKEYRISSKISSGTIRNDTETNNSVAAAPANIRHIKFEPTVKLRQSSAQFTSNNRQNTSQRTFGNHMIGTENYFVGKRIAGKAVDSRTPMIKSYWEANIQREEKLKEESNNIQKKKTFGFPRWRSNDALSASLVASKGNVEIPADSKIPQHRLQKLEQTERLAQQTKAMIHQNAEVPKKLQKGKSLDSLIMQLDYQPWYDRNQIRDGISRESIANLVATKDKFESSADSRNSRRHLESVNSSGRLDSTPQMKPDQRYPTDGQKENVDTYKMFEKEETPQQENQPEFSQEKQEAPYTSSQRAFTGGQQQFVQNFKNNDINLTAEQEIFLLFLKQNTDLIAGLGIVIPQRLKNIINELPWKKVELKPVHDEEPCRLTAEFRSYQPQAFNKDSNGQMQNYKSGRYLKNPAAVNGNNSHRIISRKTFDMSAKQIPENRRPIMQKVDRERAGGSLIAAEIRMLRDREEELRRSRSELGLPSLEDTIEIWRNGYNTTTTTANNNSFQHMNPLRSAVSYDHLHQATQQIPKTASIERLHRIVDDQPRNFCDNDVSPSLNDHTQYVAVEDTQNRQNLQGARRQGMVRSIYVDEEATSVINRDQNIQKLSHYQPTYTKNQYRLQNSDDPDIMIYGPTTRRCSSTLMDSTLHLAINPITVDHQDTSLQRYK